MRRTAAAILFLTVALGLIAGGDTSQLAAQDKKAQKKKAEVVPPDEALLKQIAAKTGELRAAVAGLKAKEVRDEIVVDVEVFLKAAEWVVRHGEWLTNDAGKQTLRVLDIGTERAKHAAEGTTPWAVVSGKWVARGYRSGVDGSVQPYAVLVPDGYFERGKNAGPGYQHRERLDTVLHGRDGTLTEVKFLSGHEGKPAPKGHAADQVVVEVYGRGNNAYRWAGEADVLSAIGTVERALNLATERRVLRGFSMGGAGTWHIGLHRPSLFNVIGPGAGFTTTHGYVGGLPKELPEYVEKCLRIYDAVGYAENAFNVPVVAYSGEKDGQKKAADNIEAALKTFKGPLKFTHVVAPGLEHQQPPEWQAKLELEYRKFADNARTSPDRVRFVTYTPKYGKCDWVQIDAMDAQYEKAVVDAARTPTEVRVSTTNVRRLVLGVSTTTQAVVIDGQTVRHNDQSKRGLPLAKNGGKWEASVPDLNAKTFIKCEKLCGPIDDAFTRPFLVSAPAGGGWHPVTSSAGVARHAEFARLWDKYFRGLLPRLAGTKIDAHDFPNLVLFGDPQSNREIAKVLPQLPIKWTKDELVVNGVKYDPKTHLPVLIYPQDQLSYVVLNSGHTFKEADLKGTNALLYPRLGDWAVIKPTPTDKDPAAFEVVAAGLFDENWQFPKK